MDLNTATAADLDALPGITFEGSVTEIANSAKIAAAPSRPSGASQVAKNSGSGKNGIRISSTALAAARPPADPRMRGPRA